MSPWPGGHHSSSGSSGHFTGHEVVGPQLGLGVLDEVEREPVDGEVGILREDLQRLVGRAEGVHQHERQLDVRLLAQREHLQRDDVEEGEAVLDLERRLRARHAHAGPEAAVELDHRGLRQRDAGVLAGDLDLAERLDAAERLDGVLGDGALSRRPRAGRSSARRPGWPRGSARAPASARRMQPTPDDSWGSPYDGRMSLRSRRWGGAVVSRPGKRYLRHVARVARAARAATAADLDLRVAARRPFRQRSSPSCPRARASPPTSRSPTSPRPAG